MNTHFIKDIHIDFLRDQQTSTLHCFLNAGVMKKGATAL